VSLRIEFEFAEDPQSGSGDWVMVAPGDVTVRVESWDIDADGRARQVAEQIAEVLG
jgi:hypothetical protein